MARRRSWLWIPIFLFFVLAISWLAITWINRAFGTGGIALASSNVLVVELAGEIRERPDTLWGTRPAGSLSLREIDGALRRAATDDRIVGVRLNIGPLATGFAKAEGIRDAISAFRESGKPSVARLEIGSLLDVYVATAAETVVQIPNGMLLLGLASRAQYYRGLLDTLGIEFEAFHTGPYKSAMNPYTERGMSAEEREVMESLLDDLYGQLVTAIAADRDLDEGSVRAVIDRGMLSSAEAQAGGLVDETAFDDQIDDLVTAGSSSRVRSVSIRDYLQATGSGGWEVGRPVIAIVHVDGMIVPGDTGEPLFGTSGLAGGRTIARYLKQAREDSAVRAVILRVDSPGGAVSASDVIWREVELTAAAKPVIVSMSDVAASGGYWIATAGTRILAAPGTYTGSIGVVSARMNFSEAYAKLEIGNDIVKRGRNADILVDSQPLTEEQRQLFENANEQTYRAFIAKVAAARQMEPEEVEAIAAGRVWTGRQALEVGLVDALGGLTRAFQEARQYAGLGREQEVAVRVYPEPVSLFDRMFSAFNVAASAGDLPTADSRALGMLAPAEAQRALQVLDQIRSGGIQWALATGEVPVAVR